MDTGTHPATATDTAAATDTRPRAAAETALIIAGLLGLAFLLPHKIIGDAVVRANMLESLLDGGELIDSKYSIIGPLFAAPLWWVASLVGADPSAWIGQYNFALFAVGLLAMYVLLRNRIDRSLLRTFFLLLISASMFAAHVTGFNSETFTAMTLGVGIAATAIRSTAIAGWAAVAAGVANTPAALASLGLLIGKRVLEQRRWRYLLAGIGAVGLIGWENWLRRGSPLAAGYDNDAGIHTVMPYSGRPGFSYPLFFGLLSLVFSFGKGLLFFAPALFLPVRGSLRRLTSPRYDLERVYVWWLVVLAGLVLVYAQWWAWYGGLTWGPRFLLFASIPASLALAVRVRDLKATPTLRVVTLLALALSTWVGICAAAFPEAGFAPICFQDNYAYEALCHYTPDFSVLWYPLVAHLPVSPQDWLTIGYCTGVAGYLGWPLAASLARDVLRKSTLPR